MRGGDVCSYKLPPYEEKGGCEERIEKGEKLGF